MAAAARPAVLRNLSAGARDAPRALVAVRPQILAREPWCTPCGAANGLGFGGRATKLGIKCHLLVTHLNFGGSLTSPCSSRAVSLQVPMRKESRWLTQKVLRSQASLEVVEKRANAGRAAIAKAWNRARLQSGQRQPASARLAADSRGDRCCCGHRLGASSASGRQQCELPGRRYAPH